MTRAELRRLDREKIKAQKVYTLTQEQIDQMVEAGVKRIVKTQFNEALARETDKAFVVMMTLPCVALRDVYGFGHKRIKRFLDNTCDKYFCVLDDFDHKRREGYDFNTFIDILKDETGFDVAEYLKERGVIQPNERK